MRKGAVLAFIGGVLLLGAGAAGAYWYGNQPVKEYYPNGAIKSIAERKMYELSGKYKLFAQDGTLIEEYNQQNGIKNGNGAIYFKGGSVEFSYVNNKLSGPIKINVPEYAELFKETVLNIENSELKLTNGDFYEMNGDISCGEDDFLSHMQAFLNEQNYNNFKNFFECLTFKYASIKAEGGKCEYQGSYRFPRFLTDSEIKCKETNAEFLQGYAQGFNMVNSISSDFIESSGAKGFSAGDIGNIESLSFDSDFKMDSKKIAFALTTISDKFKLEQNGSFGGFEEMVESGIEFAYSPMNETDVKKLVLNILQNMSWSDWSAKINDKKRFTISGDFNVMNGFSDPYVMSYYSNGEVTTQWKMNDKGTQLTSKYPNSNKPMFSVGMNINDGFKKAYRALVQEGLNLAMSNNSTFNPKAFERIQNAGIAMLKGINSFSGVLMNDKGEKTISAVAALQNNFNIEQFIMSPLQFLNFKVITYQKNEPERVYEGNLMQGFALNGKKLSDKETEEQMDFVVDVLKKSVDNIADELEKAYGNLEVSEATWLDSDVDPFLFGFYKGYTAAKSQLDLNNKTDFDNDTIAEEIEKTVENIHLLYKGRTEGYAGLDNDTIVTLGIVPYDENGSAINSFGGKIVVRVSPKAEDELSGAFIIALSGIPNDECQRFLTEDMFTMPQNGLIGVAAGNMSAAPKGFAELNKLTEDSAANAGNFDIEQGYMALKPNALDETLVQKNINTFCAGHGKGNFIAVKYY